MSIFKDLFNLFFKKEPKAEGPNNYRRLFSIKTGSTQPEESMLGLSGWIEERYLENSYSLRWDFILFPYGWTSKTF